MASAPEPIQLVNSTDGQVFINIDALRSILLDDEIKDRKVCIISICGTFRQGKSFLLNFILRYLRLRYMKKLDLGTDWLREEDGPITGFSFVAGTKKCTNGINLWSEPFLAETSDGEKIVILLMDTQGTFDSNSTMDDCARIFTFSTLISSIQIYNLMRNINQCDLDHLQCFSSYGQLYIDSNSKPFQSLWILLRDWFAPDEYGYGDGEKMLENLIKESNDDGKQNFENIQALFDKINCFLLPRPGDTVDRDSKFRGQLTDIDGEFKNHVQMFVYNLLSPENLILKSIDGNLVTAKQLFYHIEDFSKIVSTTNVPKVESMHEAMVSAQCRFALDDSLDLYNVTMDTKINNNSKIPNDQKLYNIHNEAKIKSTVKFDKSRKMGSEKVIDGYLVQLKHKIDDRYQFYRQLVKEKLEQEAKRKAEATKKGQSAATEAINSYEEDMHTKIGQGHVLDRNRLKIIHNGAQSEATQYYTRTICDLNDKDIVKEYLTQLKNNMQERYKFYEDLTEKKILEENERVERVRQQQLHKKRLEEEGKRNQARLNAMRAAPRRQPTASNPANLLDEVSTGEGLAMAAAVLGGAATLAFGAFKLFSNRNQD